MTCRKAVLTFYVSKLGCLKRAQKCKYHVSVSGHFGSSEAHSAPSNDRGLKVQCSSSLDPFTNGSIFNFRIFSLAKNALSCLQVRYIQQTMARAGHQKRTPDFHGKYGNAVLASGATFCIAVCTYAVTQIGIEWNLSPVGRVTPKERRDQQSSQLV
ncbi:cytochrome c oxidase subunit 7B, mitochondrial-like [Nycticebus coucang]|uniref:cytochrome c oxidase subunit 7B, mitochondrial-like n=1 Tax=Nycticebus coucang TaxID=9470 RepID=UPI00234CC4D8|nr:cytochrome c oxidase subunit 7B, mitochondrial-like [Nycticebus coucang]